MQSGNRLVRVVHPKYAAEYRAIFEAAWFRELVSLGDIISTSVLMPEITQNLISSPEPGSLVVEHERITFPSYPCEWPLEMLCAAAELTITLSLKALSHSYCLKDATPYNVLFRGPKPVFVDVLSFEARSQHDPIWLAYGQFVRMFLLPALMDAHYNMACHNLFLSHRNGIEPEEVYQLLGPLARIMPPFLGIVTLPVLLASKAQAKSVSLYSPKSIANPEQAQYILTTRYNSLIDKIKSHSKRRNFAQTWTLYTQTCSYTYDDTICKTAFVEQFLHRERPSKVLDVGCNIGNFSVLAARHGADVVAIDLDPESVGILWQKARIENASILPLVVNIARPTPALGWRNCETHSFLDRAEKYFDAVFMLAVVHHLLVTEQIPLDEIITMAALLTKDWLVIEYVGPDDPQFKRLLKGRDQLYVWYDQEAFEHALAVSFEIIQSEQIMGNTRWLYLVRSKTR